MKPFDQSQLMVKSGRKREQSMVRKLLLLRSIKIVLLRLHLLNVEVMKIISISVLNQLQAGDCRVAQQREVSSILDPNLLLIEEEH